MEHSQKAPLPPLWSLQLSSLLTMKGGNLSQLNDYAMTHPCMWRAQTLGDARGIKGREVETCFISHFGAQVTNMSISAGDIRLSPAKGCDCNKCRCLRGVWHSWYFHFFFFIFSPIHTRTHWLSGASEPDRSNESYRLSDHAGRLVSLPA